MTCFLPSFLHSFIEQVLNVQCEPGCALFAGFITLNNQVKNPCIQEAFIPVEETRNKHSK